MKHTIESISNYITNLLTKARKPVRLLSNALILCSALKRPGLSTMLSVANIVNDLNRFGIPTGPMPDGSPNLTVAMVYSIVNEVYRSLREDMVMQVTLTPGSVSFVGYGANAAGSVVVQGTSTNSGNGVAVVAPSDS